MRRPKRKKSKKAARAQDPDTFAGDTWRNDRFLGFSNGRSIFATP
jgi:hypothetical protein